MAQWLVLNDALWNVLSFAPLVFGVLAGILLAASRTRLGWTPHCRRCGHDLRSNVDSNVCPECGAALSGRGAVASGQRRLRWRALVVALALGSLAALAMPRAPLNVNRWRAALARLVPHTELLAERQNTRLGLWRNEISRRAQARDRDFVAAAIDDVVSGEQKSPSFDVLRELDRNSALNDDDHRAIAAALAEGVEAGRVLPALMVAAIGLFAQSGSDPYLRAFVARPAAATYLAELRIAPEPVTEHSIVTLTASTRNPTLQLEILDIAFRPMGSTEWSDAPCDSTRATSAWTESRHWKELPKPGTYEVRCDARLTVPASEDGLLPELTAPVSMIGTMTRVDTARVPIVAREGEAARAEVEPLLRQVRLQVVANDAFSSVTVGRAKPLRGPKTTTSIVVIGDVEVIQGEGSWRIGSVQLGTGWSGFGSDGVESNKRAFDPSKPCVLRIRPNEATVRKHAERVREYLSEPVELHFPNAQSGPDSITWLNDTAKQ